MSSSPGRRKCGCGSGRKLRDCCAKKFPRDYLIEFTVAKDTVLNSISLNPAEGAVKLTSNGELIELSTAISEVSFIRQSGKKKVVARAQTDLKSPSVFPDLAVLKKDFILAVDTNTKMINGELVSAGVVVQLSMQRVSDSEILSRTAPVFAFELINVSGEPEKVVWQQACQMIGSHLTSLPHISCGMIVDHALGQLEAFNDRNISIIGEWKLPDRFTMFYATADTTSDTVCNRALKEADTLASQILRAFKSSLDYQKEGFVPGKDGELFQFLKVGYWNREKMQFEKIAPAGNPLIF